MLHTKKRSVYIPFNNPVENKCLYLQNKEILFTGHTFSILLLGVQQHLPTHTHKQIIFVWSHFDLIEENMLKLEFSHPNNFTFVL